jgi:RimJ/RimL family protein N-acetyltransferase
LSASAWARRDRRGVVLGLSCHRSRGYARRALALLAAWAFSEAGVERLEVHVELDNAASRSVAETAGFTREGLVRERESIDGRSRRMALYALQAGEATRLRPASRRPEGR